MVAAVDGIILTRFLCVQLGLRGMQSSHLSYGTPSCKAVTSMYRPDLVAVSFKLTCLKDFCVESWELVVYSMEYVLVLASVF